MAATYTGQIEQLKNTLGDAQEAFGRFVGFITSDGDKAFSLLIGWGEKLNKLFGETLVLAFSEVQAQLAKMLAGISEELAAIAQQLSRLPVVGSRAGEMARQLRTVSFFMAGRVPELRERGNIAATAAGGISPENAKRTANALGEVTEARKKELALIEKFRKEIARGAVERNYKAASNALIETAHAAGEAGAALDDGLIKPASELPEVLRPPQQAIIDWSGSLQDLTNQMLTLSSVTGGAVGMLAKFVAGVSSGIAGLMTGLERFRQAGQVGGLGGLLGQITGLGGLVTGGLAIGKNIWGGIKSLFGFGGPSEEQKAAERAAKEAERLADELERAERRAKGIESAIGGLRQIIDSLVYTDAGGNVLQTFTDPKFGEHAATLFSSTFWAVWREQGIEGLEKLRPMWDKLHEQLIDLGLDPTALGLGRIGNLMSQVADPRTRALLGVSRGAGQLVSGMMDAGYLSRDDLVAATAMSEAAFDELVTQGMDQATAAHAMAADLTALAAAYDAQGQAMPQWLANALSGAGIEVLPTQLRVLEQSLETQKGILRALGGGTGMDTGGRPVGYPESSPWPPRQFATGGRGNFGTKGELVELHGREVIIPEAAIEAATRAGEGTAEITPSGMLIPGRPRQVKQTLQSVNITPQITVAIDANASKEAREDAARAAVEAATRAFQEREPALIIAAREALGEGV
jgi:hypothetical protein